MGSFSDAAKNAMLDGIRPAQASLHSGDPGTRGKRRREYYEPPRPDMRLEVERGVRLILGEPDPAERVTALKAKPAAALDYDEEEDLLWLLAA